MSVKLFAYHNGNNGVSHYRVWQPMKYLARIDGFEVKRLPNRTERIQWQGLTGPCNVPGIGSHSEITENADVIFSNYRPLLEDRVRLICQAKLKPLILDIDDDILNIDKSNPNYAAWHGLDGRKDIVMEIPEGKEADSFWVEKSAKNGARIVQNEKDGKWYLVQPMVPIMENVIEQIKAAHLVTTTNERLKSLYSRFNKNIVVIPNGIDFEAFESMPVRNDDGTVRFGLFGSNSHYPDWRECVESMAKILQDFPQARLVINSWMLAEAKQGAALTEMERKHQFPDYFSEYGLLDNEQVEIHEPCEIQHYHKWLQDKKIDVGLAPLKNTIFNRSKSNLRYLEFSAMRVPGIYSEAEPFECVKHGMTGFIAGNPAEWYKAMKELITNADGRRVMGNRAWLDVKNRYDQEIISAKLGAEIKKLLEASDEEKILARTGLVAGR